jgi:hypothetical protein
MQLRLTEAKVMIFLWSASNLPDFFARRQVNSGINFFVLNTSFLVFLSASGEAVRSSFRPSPRSGRVEESPPRPRSVEEEISPLRFAPVEMTGWPRFAR